jgi:hypothetical protein
MVGLTHRRAVVTDGKVAWGEITVNSLTAMAKESRLLKSQRVLSAQPHLVENHVVVLDASRMERRKNRQQNVLVQRAVLARRLAFISRHKTNNNQP